MAGNTIVMFAATQGPKTLGFATYHSDRVRNRSLEHGFVKMG